MEEDGLVAGDRLPSERELSSRLNVGRSSVRSVACFRTCRIN